MGLDQYIFRVKGKKLESSKDIKDDDKIAYFRKVNCLQNYFEQKHEIENCVPHVISLDDIKDILDKVDKVLENHSLAEQLFPNCVGFFYGSLDYGEEYFDDLKEIKKAFSFILEEWKEEDNFYYYCWY